MGDCHLEHIVIIGVVMERKSHRGSFLFIGRIPAVVSLWRGSLTGRANRPRPLAIWKSTSRPTEYRRVKQLRMCLQRARLNW